MKDKIKVICSNMDELPYYGKAERERQVPYDSTYMWNLKYDTNEHIYETDSETQRTDLRLPRGRVGRIRNLGFADKLLYTGWIKKVLI